MKRVGSVVPAVGAGVLLLLAAACGVLDRTPPPNIPGTVVAESATVAAQAAEEARKAVSTVVALATPEPPPTSSPVPPTPTPSPTPAPLPTVAPTATPGPIVPGLDRGATIVTSLGRQVEVTVTGFPDNSLRFDQLVLAIDHIEGLLGLAYPAPAVTMQRVETVPGEFCGVNQPSYAPPVADGPHVVDGSFISITVDEACDDVFATIAHEVAHTWFHGSAEASEWIDEGLANAIERQVVALAQPEAGHPVYPPVTYCRDYANISELEQANPPISGGGAWSGFSCHYTLGDGVFGELQEHYGHNGFNQRIPRLARQVVNESDKELGIADVRNTLGDDPVALEIIDRWHSGQPAMRKYRHLDAIEWIFPPTIDGQYLHFAGRTAEPGTVLDFLLEDHSYCSQFSLWNDAGDQVWMTSISEPLPSGWIHAEIPEVVAVSDLIDPQTGEFSVTAKFHNPSLVSIPELSLLVSGRSLATGDDLCGESPRYSQIPVIYGSIPAELKVARHYHSDAIAWHVPPVLSGNTLTFRGQAQPGAVSLEWQDGYCGQFSLYERDVWGYHYIESLNPKAPPGQFWGSSPLGEITFHRTAVDGSFEATAELTPGVLEPYGNPVLIVTAPAPVDADTLLCAESEVLSAVDILRN